MADSKISELNPITGSQVDDSVDVLAIADISASETKKITREQLFREVTIVNGSMDGVVIGGTTAANASFLDTVIQGHMAIGSTVNANIPFVIESDNTVHSDMNQSLASTALRLQIKDQGSVVWTYGKTDSNDFDIYNAVTGTTPLTLKANGTTFFNDNVFMDNNLIIGSETTSSQTRVDLFSGDANSYTTLARNAGANGATFLRHYGTGSLQFNVMDAAAITMKTSDSLRLTLSATGIFDFEGNPINNASKVTLGTASQGSGILNLSDATPNLRWYETDTGNPDTGNWGARVSGGNFVISPYNASNVSVNSYRITGSSIGQASDHRWYTGDSVERMRLDGPYLGVGTTSPENHLHILGGTPALMIEENDANVDESKTRVRMAAGEFQIQATNDASSMAQVMYAIVRDGAAADSHEWFIGSEQRLGMDGTGFLIGGTGNSNVHFVRTNGPVNLYSKRSDVYDDTANLFQFADKDNNVVARISGLGTTLHDAKSVVTREKGDARYGRLDTDNTWDGVQYLTAGQTYLGHGGSSTLFFERTDSVSYINVKRTNHASSNAVLSFRDADNEVIATVYGGGTTISNDKAIVTKEKGDAIYAALSGGNTFNGNQTINSKVTIANTSAVGLAFERGASGEVSLGIFDGSQDIQYRVDNVAKGVFPAGAATSGNHFLKQSDGDSRYLQLTGGDLSGDLEIKGADSSSCNLYFDNQTANKKFRLGHTDAGALLVRYDHGGAAETDFYFRDTFSTDTDVVTRLRGDGRYLQLGTEGVNQTMNGTLTLEDSGDAFVIIKSTGGGSDDDAILQLDANGTDGESVLEFFNTGAQKAVIEWFNTENQMNITTVPSGSFIDLQPAGGLTMRVLDRPSGTTSGRLVSFYNDDGTTCGHIGTEDTDIWIGEGQVGMQFQLTGADRIDPFDTDAGTVRDNAIDLGGASSRWDDIYATNGTIQTSDENEKTDINILSEAEEAVARECKGLLRKFRWKDSKEIKGDDARIHFGIIAQDLEQAFKNHGLDARDYAMFIENMYEDSDGNVQWRLGVRYTELLAFIIAAI